MTLTSTTPGPCIATPGYAGFIPSLKNQQGASYGNATRHIIDTDPTLKQGRIQRAIAEEQRRPDRAPPVTLPAPGGGGGGGGGGTRRVLDSKGRYQSGDDRSSNPPVPGYTGFIPRSQEHFGKPFVQATSESLADFQAMLTANKRRSPRVQTIATARVVQAAATTAATSAVPTFCYSEAGASPYKSGAGAGASTFISGYTGFVPRLQKHFGEPYSDSVRHAIQEFTRDRDHKGQSQSSSSASPSASGMGNVIVTTRPIPGCTVFIPGSKYGYATTFGKASEMAYEAFNRRDARGRIPDDCSGGNRDTTTTTTTGGRTRKLLNKPISGYRGHVAVKDYKI